MVKMQIRGFHLTVTIYSNLDYSVVVSSANTIDTNLLETLSYLHIK